MINYSEKGNIYIYIYIYIYKTESLFCTPEINTFQINYTSIKINKCEKKDVCLLGPELRWVFLLALLMQIRP